MNELLRLSAIEMNKKILAKEVSPTEALEAHIARIEEVNPALNALAEDDFARARKVAHQQSEQLVKDPSLRPPLFGVPFTAKEMFAVEGLKRTGGCIHYRNETMTWDATVVARMKNAGAILLGTTNMPELGFWFECDNRVYGRTNNPYDLSRTCGGSSGGEGALIGAGATPLGLGSDIGGSIRMPASFCGVFGHKPSRFLLPLTGHFPFSREEFKTALVGKKYPYTSMGPMTRKAADLSLMLKILMGSDGIDQETLRAPSLPASTESWKGRKVLLCPAPVIAKARATEPELTAVVKKCGAFFADLGAEVQELPSRFFEHSTELWFAALKQTRSRYLYETLKGPRKPLAIAKEILKIALGQGNYTLPNLVVSLAELYERPPLDLREEMQALAQMQKDLETHLGPEGLLLLPPHPRVAPRHQAPLWSPFDFIYTAIFTTLGFPATSIPMGLNSDGLPLGVQVVAPYLRDDLALSCAELLEAAFGGWQAPGEICLLP